MSRLEGAASGLGALLLVAFLALVPTGAGLLAGSEAATAWAAAPPRVQGGVAASDPAALGAASGSAASGSAASGSAASGTPPLLRMVGQTSWVRAGHPFVLDLSVTGVPASSPAAAGYRLEVSVYPKLLSRSSFDASMKSKPAGYPLSQLGAFSLASLPADPAHAGAVTLPIPVASPGHPASSSVGAASQAASGRGAPAPNPPARIPAVDLSSCGAACGGVYPVVVSLERSGSAKVLDHLTTDMIFTDVLPTTKKLDLALALPVAAPPAASGRGVPQISDAAAASLRTLATALTSHPAAALTIVPSPLTLEALAHTSAPAGGSVLADVSAWAASPDHQVVGRPFAPVDVAALARAGLSGELAPQMLRGTAAIGTSLHVQPGPGTWVSHTGLSEPALGLLAHLKGGGVHHLVLPAGALVPLFEKITPVQPFLLTGPAGTQVEAVAADAGLAAHLTDGPRPELAAHQLLADLSTIYFDQPNADYTRGVVLDVPPSWTPDATVLDTVLGALVHSPIVSPVTLDQLFGQVGLATFEGANVVRHLRSGTMTAGSGAASGGAPGTSAAAGGLPPGSAGPGSGPGTSGLPASALAGHRKRLRAFLSSAKPGPSVVTGMENLMLVSESAGLSRATRTSYLDDLDRAVDGQLDLLSLPPETVTLTSHTGKIPITVVSHAPYPIHAILEVSSDKLSFPGHGRSPGTVSTPVVVTQRQTPVYFKVQARARGEFPLSIWLYSSHGHLLLLSGQFAVRSSGISGVAIGLTVAAGAVLAAWWGRTLLKGRQKRNRRLVPTGH